MSSSHHPDASFARDENVMHDFLLLARRRAHIGASAELAAVAEELIQVIRLMDGLNRYRFADDADSLAE